MVDDETGDDLGPVDDLELVTVGQRRGMGHGTDGRRRYVTSVDLTARRVLVGPPESANAPGVELNTVTWVDEPWPQGAAAIAQCSAHGVPVGCVLAPSGDGGDGGGDGDEGLAVRFDRPQRRIAPGQTVALYDPGRPELVIGSGIAR
jgi:tRNA U34 2-thiouridine synthase MnmA/TrmU